MKPEGSPVWGESFFRGLGWLVSGGLEGSRMGVQLTGGGEVCITLHGAIPWWGLVIIILLVINLACCLPCLVPRCCTCGWNIFGRVYDVVGEIHSAAGDRHRRTEPSPGRRSSGL